MAKTQPPGHRHTTSASPLSLSLESFPSLSSLSHGHDKDFLSEDEGDEDEVVEPPSRLRASWKPVVLAPLSSDGESVYESYDVPVEEDGDEEYPSPQRLRVSASPSYDALEDRRKHASIVVDEREDEAVEADDEEPELSFRRRSSQRLSLSPRTRRSSEKAGRVVWRQSQHVISENRDEETDYRTSDRDTATSPVRKQTATTVKSDATRDESPVIRLRQEHFVACFVRVDPPLLRSLTHLELSSLNLKRTDLRALASNLFLLEALRSISLEDNQLDDSCMKEIRMILSLEGLLHVNLSRNLLGRGAARMIADRLKHRLALRSLDIAGNPWFFAFDDAADVARVLALGLASNQNIVELRVSLPVHYAHLERDRFVIPPPPPPQPAASRSNKTHPPGNRGSFTDRDHTASAAEAFTRELAQELSQHPQSRALHSLGLVHAELSRTSIVNLMKITNKLLVLDLSFAFAGIPAAQVIAAALKMNDFATLTDLNLKGNRLKTMGTRAICRALHVNARLTSLNLSRNDIRSDIVPDLSAMLAVNRTLVRLDLSQNQELFSGVDDERCASWKTLVRAMQSQGALRFLGDLSRTPMSTSIHQGLQHQLDENQQRSDDLVLLAVHQSMEFEAALAEKRSKSTKPPPSIGSLHTATLSSCGPSSKTLWTLRSAIAKQSRVSVKWKLQAFHSAAATAKNTRPPLPHDIADSSGVSVHWRLVLHRKCDLRGSVDVDAARGRFPVALSSSEPFGLCSALVHCEDGDLISLIVSLTSGVDDEDGSSDAFDGSVKVLGKEFTVLPHQLTLRHILYHYDMKTHHEPSRPEVLAWQQKRIREPAKDPFTHAAELDCCYIPRTTTYRVVWRVRLSSIHPAIIAKLCAFKELLHKQLCWRLLRSQCWDPETVATIQTGSVWDFKAAVRNGSELVVSSDPVELFAGENVHVRVETFTPELSVQLQQLYVLVEATAWEHYEAIASHARQPPV